MKIRLNLTISLIMMGLLLSLTHNGQATPFTFTKIADTDTPAPGGIDNFTLFGTPSLDNGMMTFMGYDFPGGVGRYTSVDGSLQSVPDTNPPTFEGNEAVLGVDSSGRQTIYTDINSSLNVVADTNTPIPGGSGNFDFFGPSPSFNDEYVAFMGGNFSGQQGIYTNTGGSLNRVADTNTAIPGGQGNFAYFTGDLSFDGGNVAFLGFDAFGWQGIYADIGGSLTKIIGVNDSLDGKIVSSLSFGHGSLSGNNIAFTASFGGSEGIFVATPEPIYSNPEPSTLALFGVAILGTLAYGWRRRKQAAQ